MDRAIKANRANVMKTWKITFHSGAVRTMKAEFYFDVLDRLKAEAGLVKKVYADLKVFSIVLQN